MDTWHLEILEVHLPHTILLLAARNELSERIIVVPLSGREAGAVAQSVYTNLVLFAWVPKILVLDHVYEFCREVRQCLHVLRGRPRRAIHVMPKRAYARVGAQHTWPV